MGELSVWVLLRACARVRVVVVVDDDVVIVVIVVVVVVVVFSFPFSSLHPHNYTHVYSKTFGKVTRNVLNYDGGESRRGNDYTFAF